MSKIWVKSRAAEILEPCSAGFGIELPETTATDGALVLKLIFSTCRDQGRTHRLMLPIDKFSAVVFAILVTIALLRLRALAIPLLKLILRIRVLKKDAFGVRLNRSSGTPSCTSVSAY